MASPVISDTVNGNYSESVTIIHWDVIDIRLFAFLGTSIGIILLILAAVLFVRLCTLNACTLPYAVTAPAASASQHTRTLAHTCMLAGQDARMLSTLARSHARMIARSHAQTLCVYRLIE